MNLNIPDKVKNGIYIGIIAVSIIAAIVLWAGYKPENSNKDGVDSASMDATLKHKEDKVVVTVTTETIEDGLSDMGFLVTQEYYFTQVEKYTKEKKVLSIIPSSSEFMYSYEGSVLAGVDFEKIKVTKDDDAKTVNVELPESEIMTVTIDKDTFEVYSEKDSLWNPLKLEDYNMSLSEFEEAAKKKALEGGILERSDEQAKKLIIGFIRNYPSLADYDVKF
jgi:hypothetical protein